MATNEELTEASIVVARDDHMMSSVGDEVVVLDVEEGVYYGLNEVGADVWTLIQEPRSVEEIVDALFDAYAVERERCMADVIELLEQLRANGLIMLR